MRRVITKLTESALTAPIWNLLYRIADNARYKFNPAKDALQLEVTNVCNARCNFCAYRLMKRPKRIMPEPLFRMAVDRYCSSGGGDLILTPIVGEASLHGGLARMIGYARSRPEIRGISFTSNLISLDGDKFNELAGLGLTELQVSLGGLDRDEYAELFGVDKFHAVQTHLHEIADSPYRKQCHVEVWLRTNRLYCYGYFHGWLKRNFPVKRLWWYDNWSGKITNADLAGWQFIKPPRRNRPTSCVYMTGMKVLADGSVSACSCWDVDGDPQMIIGRAQDLFTRGQQNELSRLRRNMPEMCRQCREYKPI